MISNSFTTPWNWYVDKDTLPFWTQLSFNDHPPLHFASIWLATHIFGIKLWVVRLPSILYSLASIIIVVALLRYLNLKKGIYFTAFYLAILPWHIFISRTADQESGVIFWMLSTLYCILKTKEKKWYWWVMLGITFSSSLLTKYSGVMLLPIFIIFFIKYRWYKIKYFWLFIAVVSIVLSPIIIYNIQVYNLRGHFDLQVTRFLKQDTSVDWSVNEQGIWQGSMIEIFNYIKDFSSWVTLPVALYVLFGIFIILKRWKSIAFDTKILSYFGLFAGMILSVLTLSDYRRSAIVITFFIISIGALSHYVIKNKNFLLLTIFVIGILSSILVSMGDRMNKQFFSPVFAASFQKEIRGFQSFEDWFQKNFKFKEMPLHFASFNKWIDFLSDKIAKQNTPIFVYDQRFRWFGMTWYFYRHSFYNMSYPVIQSSIFVNLLLEKNDIMSDNIIYYIQVDKASKDIKAGLDSYSHVLEEILYALIQEQKVQPIIIKNYKDEIFAKIWKVRWDPRITVKIKDD